MGHGALEKYRSVNNCALMFGLLGQDPARPHSGYFGFLYGSLKTTRIIFAAEALTWLSS